MRREAAVALLVPNMTNRNTAEKYTTSSPICSMVRRARCLSDGTSGADVLRMDEAVRVRGRERGGLDGAQRSAAPWRADLHVGGAESGSHTHMDESTASLWEDAQRTDGRLWEENVSQLQPVTSAKNIKMKKFSEFFFLFGQKSHFYSSFCLNPTFKHGFKRHIHIYFKAFVLTHRVFCVTNNKK